MTSSPGSSPAPSLRARLGEATPFALVLAVGESLAALTSGVRELGLYAAQGALVFIAGLAGFALPVPRRVLALLTLAGVGLFHAAFAGYEVDRRLGAGELGLLALQGLILAAGFWRATRPEVGPLNDRQILGFFAGGYLIQALWCARFLFPSTDAHPGWVGLASMASVALAPALALVGMRR